MHTTWKNIAFLFLVYIFLLSCEAHRGPIKLEEIKIDMPKAEVLTILGKPYNAIGAKQFEEGLVEVWEYRRYGGPLAVPTLEEVYWLYFLNDNLAQWGRPVEN